MPLLSVVLPLAAVLLLAAAPVLAQSPPTQSLHLFGQSESEKFQARIDAAALALGGTPKYKGLSPKYRMGLTEFVVGNMVFVLLHEIAHAAIGDMKLPVLGKPEDAADSYAVMRLISIGTVFTHRVLVEAAKGWFLSDRRDRKEGETITYYDEHGLDKQRAYQIVCLMVGSDEQKFKDLAEETKLPAERQQTCALDYGNASYAWDLVLKPHCVPPISRGRGLTSPTANPRESLRSPARRCVPWSSWKRWHSPQASDSLGPLPSNLNCKPVAPRTRIGCRRPAKSRFATKWWPILQTSIALTALSRPPTANEQPPGHGIRILPRCAKAELRLSALKRSC